MNSYLFIGVVHPERAQLSLTLPAEALEHFTTKRQLSISVRIELNQILVFVEAKDDWDPWDLRNLVQGRLRTELAAIGYLTGFAYELDLIRLCDVSRKTTVQFGIDVSTVSNRYTGLDLPRTLAAVRSLRGGRVGMQLDRCFTDLVLAMQRPDDTAFYCYRAIEALRIHCAIKNDLANSDKRVQWKQFWKVAGGSGDELDPIRKAAESVRHGDYAPVTTEMRSDYFTRTWNVVDRYLEAVGVRVGWDGSTVATAEA